MDPGRQIHLSNNNKKFRPKNIFEQQNQKNFPEFFFFFSKKFVKDKICEKNCLKNNFFAKKFEKSFENKFLKINFSNASNYA